MGTTGGIVLQTSEGFLFLPASVASSVVSATTVVPVPGLVPPAIGLVLTDDRVATVLRIGSYPSEHMIICEIDGGSVALQGAKVIATGTFATIDDGTSDVVWREVRAKHLDVRALALEVEEAIWIAGGATGDERQE